MKGSPGSLFCLYCVVVVFNLCTTFNLCAKFLISKCKACIGSCFGFGMNFSPFLSTFFCASVRVVCLASMTKVSSFMSFIGLFVSVLTSGSKLT